MMSNNLTKENADGLLFFKEVAKYFMDFLETDFHYCLLHLRRLIPLICFHFVPKGKSRWD